jgi:hypothetical protein
MHVGHITTRLYSGGDLAPVLRTGQNLTSCTFDGLFIVLDTDIKELTTGAGGNFNTGGSDSGYEEYK